MIGAAFAQLEPEKFPDPAGDTNTVGMVILLAITGQTTEIAADCCGNAAQGIKLAWRKLENARFTKNLATDRRLVVAVRPMQVGYMRRVAWCLLLVTALGFAGQWLPPLDIINSAAPLAALVSLTIMGVAVIKGDHAIAAIGLIATIAAAAPILREATRPITTDSSNANVDQVVVVTHNVRFNNQSPAQTAVVLQSSDADVIFLQETDRYDWGGLFDRARYPYRTACRTGCSLLIISRWPIVASRYRIRNGAGEQIGPRLIWATVAPPNGLRFDVATLHLDWPSANQTRQRRALAHSIGHLATRRLILAGDFNLTPWSWAMRDSDKDLAPLTRATRATWSYPARIGATYAFPLPMLPIDQVFVGPSWMVGGVDRLPRTGSDHYPVRVRLVARSL